MEVSTFLGDLGLERYADAFRDNDIDASVLPQLTAEDLIAIGVTSVGHRRKLLAAITALAEPDTAPVTSVPAEAPAEPVVARRPTEAERRQLTVLFCDLVGSTALSAKLDPEDMREVIRGYQDCCAGVIARFDGFVAKFMGDGVLAYFGYPRAHEDEAERAVRAGLALTEAVGRLAPVAGTPLSARVGIATGRVVVGDVIGEGVSQEQAVVGETPNLAARLQGLAEPGSVVVADGTQRLLGGRFDHADLGSHALKGFAEPVRAWRIVGESQVEGRFEAMRGEQLTPLVGREHEIALLLDRWQLARGGEGQLVLLSGEPGIGKSRITQALRERVEVEPHARLRYYCSPYHINSTLHPVTEQMARAAGIRPDDDAEARLDKLEAVLGRASARVGELAPLLAALLAIPSAGRYPPLNLTPQVQKTRTFDALVEQLEGLAARQPVLMVFEDAHWIDPTTSELLEIIAERVQRLPVLLLIAFRADFTPPWTGHAHTTTITLNRLGRQQGEAMVARVTGGKPLPAEVMEQILAKTDGVPLFVEELTKTVLESGLLVELGDRYDLTGPLPSLAIPATLQDSLMARLDRLAPVKEVAQIGAAIGREFSYELLAAVAPLGDNHLLDALGQLVSSELVFRRGTPPAATYVFKHALVQDAAYQTLLRGTRSQLHARIAKVLEEQFEEQTRTEPELLARHYRQAGMLEQAIPHAIRAGDQSSGGFAFIEARARHQEALDMARALPPSAQASRFQIRATLKLANVASSRAQFESDLANLEHARTLAEELDHRPRLGQIYYWMARIHYVLGQFDRSVELAKVALRIAEELGDEKATAAPVNLLARVHCLLGQARQGIDYADRSVRQMHDLGDEVEEAGISGMLGLSYAMLGRFHEATDAIEHGIRIAERIEHRPTLAACLFYLGLVEGWCGELESSLPSFERAEAISDELGDRFRLCMIHGWRGQAHVWAGDFGTAEGDLVRALALANQIGTTFGLGGFMAYLAEVRLHAGDVAEATKLCRDALQMATETHQPWSLGIASRTLAACLLAADPPDVPGAEGAIQEAIAIQEDRGLLVELAYSLTVCARVLNAKGDKATAKATLVRAAEMFEEMGMTRDLAGAQAALAELER